MNIKLNKNKIKDLINDLISYLSNEKTENWRRMYDRDCRVNSDLYYNFIQNTLKLKSKSYNMVLNRKNMINKEDFTQFLLNRESKLTKISFNLYNFSIKDPSNIRKKYRLNSCFIPNIMVHSFLIVPDGDKFHIYQSWFMKMEFKLTYSFNSRDEFDQKFAHVFHQHVFKILNAIYDNKNPINSLSQKIFKYGDKSSLMPDKFVKSFTKDDNIIIFLKKYALS